MMNKNDEKHPESYNPYSVSYTHLDVYKRQLPRSAKAGDEIISGCINMTGVLKIKTTKEFDESTVSKILELIEESSSRKSRSENFISKFAHYYTCLLYTSRCV